jgi:hypothetical protein
MKKLNFKWLVVLCMAIGIVNVAKAQIYSSEVCFYSKEGSSNVEYVVKFDYSNDRVWLKKVSHSTVRKNLAKSEDFYEDEVWTDGKNSVEMFEYDSGRSTSAREVYKRANYSNIYSTNCIYCQRSAWTGWGYTDGCGAHGKKISGYSHVAFSTDTSIASFIKWYEKAENYDGSTGTKTYFSRVPKEDLLPKAVNDDFLY